MTLDITPERPPLTVVPDPDHRPHTDTTRETEQAILGAAITAPRLIPTIAAILTGPDYHHPEHQTIWDAITTLHDTGQPIDPITVADRLTRDATLHRAGGHLYLFDCVAACTVPANAPVWAQIVADNATRRRLADTAARITQAAALGMDPATITDHARAALDSLTAATTRTTTHTPAELLPDLIDRLDNPAIAGLPTPWPDLDRHIHGLQPGHLYIVGARPSVGKSLMAQAIAEHTSRQGGHVLLASVEMTATDITLRMLASQAGVTLDELQSGSTSPESWQRISAAHERLAGLQVHISDGAAQTPASIRATAEQIRGAHGRLDVVIVDYLQLLTPGQGKRDRNREQEVAEQSRAFKTMAKDLQVPVIVLSQLNRESETRPDRRPTMANLRESGAIEQDADCIWLLHRPDPEVPAELEVIVAKNRNGKSGASVHLLVQGEHARIVSAAKPVWTPTGVIDNG